MKRRQQLDRERIELTPHNPAWTRKFEAERLRLLEQPFLGPAHIAHIGSTAVEALCAKPTIDILIGVQKPGGLAPALASLQMAGYEYLPEYEVDTPDRMFCIRRGADGSREFHVSLTLTDGRFWRNHLMFRNRLREDETLRHQYTTLKRTLAARYEFDRARYVAGKSQFIAEELRRVLPAVEQFAEQQREESWGQASMRGAGTTRSAVVRTLRSTGASEKFGAR